MNFSVDLIVLYVVLIRRAGGPYKKPPALYRLRTKTHKAVSYELTKI